MQHATQCLSVVNNVLNLHNLLLYMDRKLEYLQLPLFSDIANYKKKIRIAKYNRRGDVVMHCHRHIHTRYESRSLLSYFLGNNSG